MDSDNLIIAAPLSHRHLSMSYLGNIFHQAKAFHFILVLACTFFCLAMCGPCLTNEMQKSAGHDACGSYGDDLDTLEYAARIPMTNMNMESVCANSHSFCFPSTLSGFSEVQKLKSDALEADRSQSDGPLSGGSNQGSRQARNESWSSDYSLFELLNGQTLSCSLKSKKDADELPSIVTDSASQNDFCSCSAHLLAQKSSGVSLNKNSEITKYSSLDVSLSPCVKISPPILDWGQKHLYFPSVASLTVVNTCNDSNLHVYEPFSTSLQFYPCNVSELFLGPGEVASICFVFLPRWLGLSSAHLILQTSFGGFLVQVKGHAVEPPYEISPLISLDAPSSRQLSKNLSLFNPFDETVYVKGVKAWISLSQENISHRVEATCSLEKFWDSDELVLLTVKDWLVLKSDKVGTPMIALRPHKNWEIGPQSGETIIETNFSLESEGKIYGAFCMQLLRASQDVPDTVVVPVEVNLDRKVAYDGITGSVSVLLEALVLSDASVVVAISLRNGTPRMLSVVKISKAVVTEGFQIKYIEGLLLFPGTFTQVAIITCTQPLFELHDSPPDMSNVNKNCNLFILTNDSSNPRIEISCQDIIQVCLRHPKDSYIGHDYHSEVASDNRRTGSLGNNIKPLLQIKALETAEADEFVLANWKSQGTASLMSVLDDHEVVFPMIQVGTHHSKWITVKNPSDKPVVMQLILHSGEIIDDCRDTYGFVQPFSLRNSAHVDFIMPTSYGFSMADGALTEAFVHPHGTASFGPIFFHPSNRCGWRSSALIRNNLSGVEWLSLRGFGGSLSLILLEESEPIQSIEFNMSLPVSLNISPPDMFSRMEETVHSCSQPLSKELYAKNMGDLPVEVKSIEVSRTGCELDGFMVHTCKGFLLKPGESTKLLISYQSDFSAAIVQRDLELVLASDVLAIPMRANLPLNVFNLCKTSVFWVRLRKFFAATLLAACLIFLIFCVIFPHVVTIGLQENYCKTGRSPISTVRSTGKSSRIHRKQKNSKLSMDTEIESLLRSAEEEKTLKPDSVGRNSNDQDGAPAKQVSAVQNVTPTVEDHEQFTIWSHNQKDKAASSLLSKSIVVENPDMLEASQLYKLTVRTGKERGRRRRKRKGINAGLTGLFEVSSSQSGNSTPSSPLSPVMSATASRISSPFRDADLVEARNSFIQAGDQHCEKVQASKPASKAIVLEPEVSLNYLNRNCFPSMQELPSVPKNASKPVLLPSATFPCAGRAAANSIYSSSLGITSPIAPHARAPGSNLYCRKTANVEEKVGDEYAYDIWGDHFSGIHLVGSSKNDTAVKTMVTENDSSSFFVRGPQALMAKSQLKSVSCFQQEG